MIQATLALQHFQSSLSPHQYPPSKAKMQLGINEEKKVSQFVSHKFCQKVSVSNFYQQALPFI